MFGLWSIESMDAARHWFQLPWDNWAGRIVLSGTFLIHGSLAFYTLYKHRNYNALHLNEWFQLIFGLCIPPLLVLHYLGTLVVDAAFDTHPNYSWLLLIYTKGDIPAGIRQIIVLIIAWSHGCLGIYFWLRLKPYWPRIRGFMLAIALLWPVVSLLGVWDASKQVSEKFKDPVWLREILTNTNQPSPEEYEYLSLWENGFLIFYGVMICATLLLRYLRPFWEGRHGLVEITYDNGKKGKSPPGVSLLDISRMIGFPHASVCGGKGRCSTCRVRINKGCLDLPPPSPEEQKILDRVKAGADIRLACQCYPPPGTYSMSCLLPADTKVSNMQRRANSHQGQEQDITVLFADLRGFTRLSEEKLPYDVVFILNRFFATMGEAVQAHGGHLDKFIGDGVMALFGVDGDPATCSKNAINACLQMMQGIEKLNDSLAGDLKHKLQIGIGLHSGPAIIGDMGYANATQLTAIGDTVNTASRLETMTKEFNAEMILSESVLKLASLPTPSLEMHQVEIRGRNQKLCAFMLRNEDDCKTLNDLLLNSQK